MTSDTIISNPIGWAQMKLQGGMKRILTICSTYAALMLMLNIFFFRVIPEPISLSVFASTSLTITVFLQAGLLFLVGASAIKKAIHRDFTSDMITSHRTTAMTCHTAVLGYLTGPTLTVLCLSLVNWFACTILAILAGQPLIAPTVIFAVFGSLVAMVWTLAVLVALSTRGTTSIVGALIVLMIVANQPFFLIHPGSALLLGRMVVVNLSIVAATGTENVDVSIFVSMLSQVVMAAIFYLAAARKFTRDDVAAFNPQLAYTLLAVYTLVSAVALRFWPGTTGFAGFPVAFTYASVQTIVTLSSLAMVALLPVANAARNSAEWSKRKTKDPDFKGRKPRPFVEAPIIATFLVFSIFLAVAGQKTWEVLTENETLPVPWMMTCVVCAFVFALLPIAGLLRFSYAITTKALWPLFLFLFLAWAIPPMIDLMLGVLHDRYPSEPKSWVFGCSPVSTWILAFTTVKGPIIPGLIVQAALGISTLFLARKAKY